MELGGWAKVFLCILLVVPVAHAIPISTCGELQNISLDRFGEYFLVTDIDCSDTPTWNGGAGFEPIEGSGQPFEGVLDGRGFTISHVYINYTGQEGNHWGLFTRIGADGSVFNLTIENITVISETSASFVGGLTGVLSGVVRDVSVQGNITVNATRVGGLAGMTNFQAQILRARTNITIVSQDENVGGLVGEVRNGVIRQSSATGTIEGRGTVGGLVGWAGGVFLWNPASGFIEIQESFSHGPVFAEGIAGGLVGNARDGVRIQNSFSTANVTRTGTANLFGGLLGTCFNATIHDSYATGWVNGTGSILVGGLTGRNDDLCVAENSFWDTQTTNQSTSDLGVGKTTAELQNISTFRDTATVGLDDAWSLTYNIVRPRTTWVIDDGNDYPQLAWTQDADLPLFVCSVVESPSCPLDYAHLIGLQNGQGGVDNAHAQLSNPLRRMNVSFTSDTPTRITVADDGSVRILYHMFVRSLSPTGELLWEQAHFPANTVTIDSDGNTYYPTGNNLRAYKISPSGDVVWMVQFPGETRAVAVDEDQNAYVVGRDDSIQLLYKINSTGQQEWNVTLNATVIEVAYSPGRVHVSGNEVLWNFDTEGNLQWFYNSTDGWLYRALAADAEGNTYASSQGSALIKLNSTGDVVWETFPGSFYIARGTLRVDEDQYIYGSTSDGRVVKVYPDGALKWLLEPDNTPGGVAVDQNGRIYVTQGDFLDIYRDLHIPEYANSLCCLGGANTLTNMCGETAFYLSRDNNAQVQSPSIGTYPEPVCLSQPLWNFTCVTREGSCEQEEFCVASMSAEDNAHISTCGNYAFSVCCGAIQIVPDVPELLTPEDGENTSEVRQPEFTWTSVEFASYYTLNITAPDTCSSISLMNLSATSYTPPSTLCTDREYNWTVRACTADDVCSDWAAPFSFEIPSVISIEFTQSAVDFGTLDASTSEETVERNTIDDAPDPLRVRNTGNVLVAYDFRALTTLWENEALGTEYFQFRDQTAASWNNISSTAQDVFTGLGIESERDIEIRVQVPVLEPPGAKSSTVQVIAEMSE